MNSFADDDLNVHYDNLILALTLSQTIPGFYNPGLQAF